MFLLIILGILLFLAIIMICLGIMIIPNEKSYIVERLGKYQRTVGTGLHFKIPFLETIRAKVSNQIVAMDLTDQEAYTADQVEVKMTQSVKYRIVDFDKFVYGNQNSIFAMEQDCRSALRVIVGKMTFEELNANQSHLNDDLRNQLDGITDKYGIDVIAINVGDVDIDESLRIALQDKIIAKNKADAKINEANGEKQSQLIRANATKEARVIEAQGELEAAENLAAAQKARLESEYLYLKEQGLSEESIRALMDLKAKESLANGHATVFVGGSASKELEIAQILAIADKIK